MYSMTSKSSFRNGFSGGFKVNDAPEKFDVDEKGRTNICTTIFSN
jgi:hypothetical protein